MDLYAELVSVVEAFEKERIDYALCGGLAVAVYGYPRFTKDMDFLVQENDLARIEKAVQELGYDFPSGIISFASGTDEERRLFRISKIVGSEVFTLDFLLVSPIYESVWEDREVFSWQQLTLQIVSLDGLAKMKRLAGREQDKLDLRKLGLLEGEDEGKN